MPGLQLYTHPQSRGRIAHWMMEELGEPYETVWVGYDEMKAAPFRGVNPMGKVPTLRDGETVVSEAAAICAYLADRFPERGLAPPLGSAERAAYFRWLFFAAGPLEQAVTARAMGWQVPEGRDVMAGFGSYERTLDALETALAPGPWICGDQFTAADVYVGSQIGWGVMFGTIEKRPAFEAYVGRVYARPAAARANELNAARLAATGDGAR